MGDLSKVSIPIYLVSLKQDALRREKIKKQFSKTYEEFQIIDAIDGREISAKEYFKSIQGYFNKYKRIMSPAELGCTLSHIKALESFLYSDNKYALILEDDVIGTDESIYKICSLVDSLTDNSLLLCGGQLNFPEKRYRYSKKITNEEICVVHNFSYKFMYGTCCYLVTRKSAKKILEHHSNTHITLADKWDVFFKDSKIKIYYIDILKHPVDLTDSHIESDRAINKKSLLEKIFVRDILLKIFRRVYWELMSLVLKFRMYTRIK